MRGHALRASSARRTRNLFSTAVLVLSGDEDHARKQESEGCCNSCGSFRANERDTTRTFDECCSSNCPRNGSESISFRERPASRTANVLFLCSINRRVNTRSLPIHPPISGQSEIRPYDYYPFPRSHDGPPLRSTPHSTDHRGAADRDPPRNKFTSQNYARPPASARLRGFRWSVPNGLPGGRIGRRTPRGYPGRRLGGGLQGRAAQALRLQAPPDHDAGGVSESVRAVGGFFSSSSVVSYFRVCPFPERMFRR